MLLEHRNPSVSQYLVSTKLWLLQKAGAPDNDLQRHLLSAKERPPAFVIYSVIVTRGRLASSVEGFIYSHILTHARSRSLFLPALEFFPVQKNRT